MFLKLKQSEQYVSRVQVLVPDSHPGYRRFRRGTAVKDGHWWLAEKSTELLGWRSVCSYSKGGRAGASASDLVQIPNPSFTSCVTLNT